VHERVRSMEEVSPDCLHEVKRLSRFCHPDSGEQNPRAGAGTEAEAAGTIVGLAAGRAAFAESCSGAEPCLGSLVRQSFPVVRLGSELAHP
jgi:hypothetical protein